MLLTDLIHTNILEIKIKKTRKQTYKWGIRIQTYDDIMWGLSCQRKIRSNLRGLSVLSVFIKCTLCEWRLKGMILICSSHINVTTHIFKPPRLAEL